MKLFRLSKRMYNLNSIHSKSMPGFKLGFISDFKLYYPFDLRTLLQVSFSEFRMDYYNVDGTVFSDTRPATFLETPILIKYKSKRRKNKPRIQTLSGQGLISRSLPPESAKRRRQNPRIPLLNPRQRSGYDRKVLRSRWDLCRKIRVL